MEQYGVTYAMAGASVVGAVLLFFGSWLRKQIKLDDRAIKAVDLMQQTIGDLRSELQRVTAERDRLSAQVVDMATNYHEAFEREAAKLRDEHSSQIDELREEVRQTQRELAEVRHSHADCTARLEALEKASRRRREGEDAKP